MKLLYCMILVIIPGILHGVCHHKPKPRPHVYKPLQQEKIPDVQQTIADVVDNSKPQAKLQESPESIKPPTLIQSSLQPEAEPQQSTPEKNDTPSTFPKKIIARYSVILLLTSAVIHYYTSNRLNNRLSILRNNHSISQ